MKRPTLFFLALLVSAPGCLSHALRGPAADHHMQTVTILNACRDGKYGACSDDLVEDLEAMAKQACLMEAIATKVDASGCRGASR